MNATTTILPPGTQLQLMYVEERLKPSHPGHFIEIGPGNGDITRLLLDLGWTGQSMDLDALTFQRLQVRFVNEIATGKWQATVGDYVATPPDIAGSCRRYPLAAVKDLASKTGWMVDQLSGLAYPLSNMLLSLFNHLVRKNEAEELQRPELEKTRRSGRRHVKYKTHLLAALGWFEAYPASRYPIAAAFPAFEESTDAVFRTRPFEKAVSSA
jgi:hypothetical protein